MLNENTEIDNIDDDIVNEDEDNLNQTDYTDVTTIYRKKLIRKISIVLGSSVLIFITRFFKHAPFDIIVASPLFIFLLGVSVMIGVGILLYMHSSKNALALEKENKMHRSLLNIYDLISVVPIFMAVVSLINIIAISPATVIGQSMEPTFYEGQDIMMAHINKNYERFDVVVLETVNGDFYLKRIIGLPGDHIEIDHSIITINGDIIDQEFLENEYGSIDVYTYCNSSHLLVCEYDVPANYYFVLGDNREHSLDSRSDELGFVHEDQLFGTVVVKFNNIFRNVLNQEWFSWNKYNGIQVTWLKPKNK